MGKTSKETKLRNDLVAIYFFLAIGILAPITTLCLPADSPKKLLKVVIPTLAVIFVSWFQKNAAQLLQQSGSFAVPGVFELRQRYLLHVNRLERAGLGLAIYAVLFSAID